MRENLLIILTIALVVSGCHSNTWMTCVEHNCSESEVCIKNAPSDLPTCVHCQRICPEETHCVVTDDVLRCVDDQTCDDTECPPGMRCVPHRAGYVTCEFIECDDDCLTSEVDILDDDYEQFLMCSEEHLFIEERCYSTQWPCEQENIENPSFRVTSLYVTEPLALSQHDQTQAIFQDLMTTLSTQILIEISREDETMNIRYGEPLRDVPPIPIDEFCTVEVNRRHPSYENIPILIENNSFSTLDHRGNFDLIFNEGYLDLFSQFQLRYIEFHDVEISPDFSMAGYAPMQYVHFFEMGEVWFDGLSVEQENIEDFWIRSGTITGFITLEEVVRAQRDFDLQLCDILCSLWWCGLADETPSWVCAEGLVPPQELPELGGQLGWRFEAEIALGAVTIYD